MTEKTAKEVFDVLLSAIRRHQFIDIGTFLIDEVSKANEFERFDEKYEYISTNTAISLLEAEANRPQGSIDALHKLVNASILYFDSANKIPDNYLYIINELSQSAESVESAGAKYSINMEGIDGEAINIDSSLNTKSVNELLELLEKIEKGFEQSDEEFLNSI